jgi:DNA-binding NarL/FixJ family response regulator
VIANPVRTVVIDDHRVIRECVSRKMAGHDQGRFKVVPYGGEVRSAVEAREKFQPHLVICN